MYWLPTCQTPAIRLQHFNATYCDIVEFRNLPILTVTDFGLLPTSPWLKKKKTWQQTEHWYVDFVTFYRSQQQELWITKAGGKCRKTKGLISRTMALYALWISVRLLGNFCKTSKYITGAMFFIGIKRFPDEFSCNYTVVFLDRQRARF